MERISDTYWPAAPHRRTGAGSTGRALLLARRRKQQQTILIAAAVLFACAAVITILSGVKKVMAVWHNEPPAAAGSPAPTGTQISLPALGAEIPRLPTHPVRILLLGSDQREGDPGYRTDVMVLVTVDTANFTATAVSFPRDLWVEPPTLYPMKINMIQAIGGFDALAAMFESNFGVRPDYYVLTNFSGFSHLIDSLGGIDVHVHEPLKDSCDLPQAPGGVCDLQPGVQPMDGATALWYVRSRESTSDFDRLRRAQEVVQAVFERMMNLNAVAQLPAFYTLLSQDVETNLSLEAITPLVPVAARLFQQPERIQRFAVTEEMATPSWSWDGMWILLPDMEKIGEVLEGAGAR